MERLSYEWLDLDTDESRPSNALADINCPRCLKRIIWALACDRANHLTEKHGRDDAREIVMLSILHELDRTEPAS